MRGERLRQTLRLYTILTCTKRTKYLRDKQIFGAIGENCNVMSRKMPLYAKLIKLGNNVRLASNVTFVTHDVTHVMLNANPILNAYPESLGPVEENIDGATANWCWEQFYKEHAEKQA